MPNVRKIREKAGALMEDVHLSDAAAVRELNRRNSEIAERRRQYAIAREKRRDEERRKIPEQMEARESALMPGYVKHLGRDAYLKLKIYDDRIRVLTLDNCEHMGNATYALSVILPISTAHSRVEKILEEVDKFFTDNVIVPIRAQQHYAVQAAKEAGFSLEDTEDVFELAIDPPKIRYRSRTPSCSKWLNWCMQADMAARSLLKLSHFGAISEKDYYDRVSAMIDALRSHALFVYETRRTAFEYLRRATEKNEENRQELEKVRQDLRENEGLELSEEGEISEVNARKASDAQAGDSGNTEEKPAENAETEQDKEFPGTQEKTDSANLSEKAVKKEA